jgi:subtilisin family serine protease
MPAADPDPLRKVDASLLAALEARRRARTAPERVGAAVVFTGELEALRAMGFEAASVVRHAGAGLSIAAGSTAVDHLAKLAALDQVISVEGGRAMKPEIDDSVPLIGADILHRGVGFLPPLKGAGVVIGIIDSGIDFRHGTFRKSNGRTRLIALWDQTLPPGTPGSPPAAPFDYGIEYSRDQIDSALGELGPTVPIHTVDRDGHGTHVAGIAAGDGSQPGNCHGAGHFVGVAPEADLIVVHLVRKFVDGVVDPKNLQQAFEYIFTHPLVLGRPVVVNYSQGDNLGPHDGTTALERAIDGLVLGRPGRAVVKSVGNEGASGRHAEVPVPAAGAALRLRVGEEDRGPRAIEAWYPGAARLSVQVFAPGLAQPSQVVAAGAGAVTWILEPAAPAEEQTRVVIRSHLGVPQNGDNRITIGIERDSGFVPAGPWTIQLGNTGSGPTTLHAWLDNDDPKTTQFLPPHVSERHTVTTPGTARHVITVGAFDDRTSGKEGTLAAFSSRGPVRRLVDPAPGPPGPGDDTRRPDVVAPGVGITSAKPDVKESSCCDCCVDHYTGLSNDKGTSVAAPHVTGVVALMLERNKFLHVDRIREILRDTAAPLDGSPSPLPPDELNRQGNGRVNALLAVERVVPPLPGGGGPGLALRHGDGGGRHPTVGQCPALAGFAPFRPAFLALRREVLSTPEGQLGAALVSRHFSEARGLIRSNRRVAVAWQRAQGPAFVRGLVRALVARERGGVGGPALPELPEGFARFLSALARHGSAPLRADVDAHGGAFASLVRGALHQLRSLASAA